MKLVRRLCKNLRRIPFHRDMYLQMMEMVLEKYYGSCLGHYKGWKYWSYGWRMKKCNLNLDIISGDQLSSNNTKCTSATWVEKAEIVEILRKSPCFEAKVVIRYIMFKPFLIYRADGWWWGWWWGYIWDGTINCSSLIILYLHSGSFGTSKLHWKTIARSIAPNLYLTWKTSSSFPVWDIVW
jgi:hypothetical protein